MPVARANRRAFIAALGGAAAWTVVAQGQQSVKRIGVLWHACNEQEEEIFLGALQQGLHERGYIEGKNIELLNRFADEHYERFDALAVELIEAKVDVVVASVGFAALSVKRVSTTVPVVFVQAVDPLGQHLVDSLAHPGGNLTGFSNMLLELTSKHLELLKDCIPKLSSVALLYNPKNPNARRLVGNAEAASLSAKIMLSLLEAQTPDELEQAFLKTAQNRPDAVLIAVDPMLYNERNRIAQAAISSRLPTIGGTGEMAEAGLLLSYGPDIRDLFRRASIYVDKILKGAKAADLPVEQPTKFTLAVNVRTARAIGVTIPDLIQLRADEVIE